MRQKKSFRKPFLWIQHIFHKFHYLQKTSLRLSDKNHLINLDKEDQKSTKFQRRKAKNCLANNKLKTKKCPKFYFSTAMPWTNKSFFPQLPQTPLSHIHIHTHPRTLKYLVTPRSFFYAAAQGMWAFVTSNFLGAVQQTASNL